MFTLKRGQIEKVVDESPPVNVQWKLYKLSADIDVKCLILTGSNAGNSGITANILRNKKQVRFDRLIYVILFVSLFSWNVFCSNLRVIFSLFKIIF